MCGKHGLGSVRTGWCRIASFWHRDWVMLRSWGHINGSRGSDSPFGPLGGCISNWIWCSIGRWLAQLGLNPVHERGHFRTAAYITLNIGSHSKSIPHTHVVIAWIDYLTLRHEKKLTVQQSPWMHCGSPVVDSQWFPASQWTPWAPHRQQQWRSLPTTTSRELSLMHCWLTEMSAGIHSSNALFSYKACNCSPGCAVAGFFYHCSSYSWTWTFLWKIPSYLRLLARSLMHEISRWAFVEHQRMWCISWCQFFVAFAADSKSMT